jgi:hypothetical protein
MATASSRATAHPGADALPAAVGPRPASKLLRALSLGLALTAMQVVIACALSGASGFRAAYCKLFCYDSWLYSSIADHGYVPPDPAALARAGDVEAEPELISNVGLMPGYPLVTRAVMAATGLQLEFALPLTAQLACWGAWTYLLLLAQRWRLSGRLTALCVLLVLAHPATFYLVVGYPESVFLTSLLGFLYWQDRPGRIAVALAAAHGLVMGATRLFGLPLALYPLLRAWLRRREGGGLRSWVAPMLLSGAAGLGGLVFFAYCQLCFGRWDMHMEALRLGWGVKPIYLALLSPRIWHVNFPRMTHGFIDPDSCSRLDAPLMLFTLLGLLALEAWLAWGGRAGGWRQRWGFYFCAGLMYYINVSGRLSVNMLGMIRYDLTVYALLALCLAHLLANAAPLRGRLRTTALVLLLLWCLAGFVLQLGFVYRYTHAIWVA